MIVTDRDDWAEALKSLRNQGRDVLDAWLTHSRLGFNYRMDEMSAAWEWHSCNASTRLLSKREQVAQWYEERLSGIEGVATPRVTAGSVAKSWFVYVIRLRDAGHRKRVMEGLSQKGVPSRPYYTPIHLPKLYVERFGYRRGSFPVSEALGDVCLALPFSGVMSESHVDYVLRPAESTRGPREQSEQKSSLVYGWSKGLLNTQFLGLMTEPSKDGGGLSRSC